MVEDLKKIKARLEAGLFTWLGSQPQCLRSEREAERHKAESAPPV